MRLFVVREEARVFAVFFQTGYLANLAISRRDLARMDGLIGSVVELVAGWRRWRALVAGGGGGDWWRETGAVEGAIAPGGVGAS